MLKIAHRGASGCEKENTLAAFKKAIELGADMIELDVRMSSDNQVLVIHDDKVVNLTFKQVWQKKWGQDVPTLEETLILLKNKCQIDIELKEPATLETVVEIVKKFKMMSQVIITSFDYETIIRLKQKNPDLQSGFIIGRQEKSQLIDLVSQAIEHKIDALFVRYNLIDELLIKKCHSNKIKIYAWTVNNRKDIQHLFKMGVDGIATDYLKLFEI